MSITDDQFFQKLQANYPQLTPGGKQVAEFLSNNLQASAFLTCAELGKACGVSETTVIRLSHVLGFSGYGEMKKLLQSIVRKKLSAREKMSTAIEHLRHSTYLREIFELEKYNLEQTFLKNSAQDIESAVEMMNNARLISVMGLGLSSSVVRFFCGRLRRVKRQVNEITAGGHLLVEKMAAVTKEDVLLAYDFPSYSFEVLKVLKFMKQKIKGKTILISDCRLGRLQSYADLTLVANSDSHAFANTITGSAMLSNMLSVGLAMKNQDQSLKQLQGNQDLADILGHSFKEV